MTNKQSLIFTCSFVAITFSLLGWLCISFLSPNKYVWIISVPIIIFIAIVESYIMTEALETEYKEQECEQLNAKLELSKVSYQTTINQLKTENERLDNELYMTVEEGRAWYDLMERYEQALTEIKEVASKEYHTELAKKDCVNCDESLHKS